MCSFFFFFQAEDGIRDLTVTGVQTCALPIADLLLVHRRGRARGARAPPARHRAGHQRRTARAETDMTFIAKPKVAHPSLPKNSLGLTRRDYEGALSTLCAGCGHDSITAAIV